MHAIAAVLNDDASMLPAVPVVPTAPTPGAAFASMLQALSAHRTAVAAILHTMLTHWAAVATMLHGVAVTLNAVAAMLHGVAVMVYAKATATCKRFCDLSQVQQKCSDLVGHYFATMNTAILRFVLRSISKDYNVLQTLTKSNHNL